LGEGSNAVVPQFETSSKRFLDDQHWRLVGIVTSNRNHAQPPAPEGDREAVASDVLPFAAGVRRRPGARARPGRALPREPLGSLAPSARASRRHGRSLGLGVCSRPLPLCIDVVPAPLCSAYGRVVRAGAIPASGVSAPAAGKRALCGRTTAWQEPSADSLPTAGEFRCCYKWMYRGRKHPRGERSSVLPGLETPCSAAGSQSLQRRIFNPPGSRDRRPRG
jgi:hypothetical protein